MNNYYTILQSLGELVIVAVSDLSVSGTTNTTISLSWTAPIGGTYAVDYYKVYLNGVFYENTIDNTNSWTITPLPEATAYNISLTTVDVNGNESLFSNMVFAQTTVTGFDFTKNLKGYWKLDSNANDYLTVHNGTANAVTWIAGKVGDCASFTGNTSKITITDSDDFSFTNGVRDLPFTMVLGIYLTSKSSNSNIISKRGVSTDLEYDLFYNTGLDRLQFNFFTSPVGNGSGFVLHSAALSLNTWYHIVITYDGSNTMEGLNLFINDVNVSNRIGDNSLYTGQQNGTQNLCFGLLSYSVNSTGYFKGRLDETALLKNRVLTASEITEAYTRFNAGTPLIP